MTMLRSLMLALFLLFAQQGSLLHALSHLPGSHKQHKNSNKSNSCEQCIAYSSIGSALNNVLCPLHLNDYPPPEYIQFNQYITKKAALQPSARDPPAFLPLA